MKGMIMQVMQFLFDHQSPFLSRFNNGKPGEYSIDIDPHNQEITKP